WANPAAMRLWRADSLDELRERDLGQDMSDSVAERLRQYQRDFESHDALFQERWTLYPEGRPVALNMRLSGLRLDDGGTAMLCEAQEAAADEPDSLRSVDALLHTAVMITLYDHAGRPLYRNPAARRAVREV